MSGAQPSVRQPRLRVLADGKALAGVLSAQITSNGYYACDHYSLELAASGGTSAWWDADPPLILDIRLSLDEGASWTSLITGEVDDIAVTMETGALSISGRDLSAQLIESGSEEAFINQTASEVVETIAKRHGLKANAKATATLLRRYYEGEHTIGTLGQYARSTTEWDLLVHLAKLEGYDLYMTGSTLNFQPAQPDATPYALKWLPPSPYPQFNAIALRMRRSLTLAKDVRVVVKSWDSANGAVVERTAEKRHRGGSSASASGGSHRTASKQTWTVVRPNLTQAQADQIALQTAHEITLHERTLDVSMPGELTLTPRSMVKLSGTGTSWDQTYYIKSLSRRLSFEGGYQQDLRLSNTSPRDTTVS